MNSFKRTGPAVVLMVEDEPMIRMLGSEVLTHAGYVVIEAEDAEAALRAIENNRHISLLFTDINMPGGMDGLALAQKVCLCRPDIRLLIVSGRPAPSAGEMPRCARFMPKPYDLSDVVEQVRQLIAAPSQCDTPPLRMSHQ
jgi:DNA-binding NtrC family response regulator